MNKKIHRKLKSGGFYCDCTNDRHESGINISSVMSFIGVAVGLAVGISILKGVNNENQ